MEVDDETGEKEKKEGGEKGESAEENVKEEEEEEAKEEEEEEEKMEEDGKEKEDSKESAGVKEEGGSEKTKDDQGEEKETSKEAESQDDKKKDEVGACRIRLRVSAFLCFTSFIPTLATSVHFPSSFVPSVFILLPSLPRLILSFFLSIYLFPSVVFLLPGQEGWRGLTVFQSGG